MYTLKIEISGESIKDVLRGLNGFKSGSMDLGNDYRTDIKAKAHFGNGDVDILYEFISDEGPVKDSDVCDAVNTLHLNDDPNMPLSP